MLDTNTVSYVVRGRSMAARARLVALKPNEIACISAITEGEIRYGIAKALHAATLAPAVEGFLGRIQVLPWGQAEAAAYGLLRAKQERLGKTLGNLDLLIAAHAIAVGAVLVTNDAAFGHVADLPGIDNWATDLAPV